MLDWLIKIDHELLLLLNGWHSPFWDEVMIKVTDRFFWVPFYALIILFLIWKHKKSSILIIGFIILTVVSSDILTSWIMKPYFERLRPCHNESISHLLRVINGCGGQFGFVSSHASNTFALVTFLILLYRNIYPFTYLLLGWSTVVSYSRIYLGVHYPGDILTGALIGVILAFSYYNFYQWSDQKLKNNSVF